MTVSNFVIVVERLECISQTPKDQEILLKPMFPKLNLTVFHLYYGNQINKNDYVASLMLL